MMTSKIATLITLLLSCPARKWPTKWVPNDTRTDRIAGSYLNQRDLLTSTIIIKFLTHILSALENDCYFLFFF